LRRKTIRESEKVPRKSLTGGIRFHLGALRNSRNQRAGEENIRKKRVAARGGVKKTSEISDGKRSREFTDRGEGEEGSKNQAAPAGLRNEESEARSAISRGKRGASKKRKSSQVPQALTWETIRRRG